VRGTDSILRPRKIAAAAVLPAGTALADGGPIMPLSQVQPGMSCIGQTVVQGTTISSFNVQVIWASL